MRFIRLVVALALALGLALVSTPARADGKDATVSVLHAVPGATVDVYANGKELLKNFKPGTLTDPMKLPAGSYDLKVVAAGAGAEGKAMIEAKGVTVPAGANITVVAHLSADATPMLTPFVNDTSASAEGARLTVRHVAAAPVVDVRAGGKVVVKGLANPKEAKLDLAATSVKADVVLTGTDKVAIGPADLSVKKGVNTIVYAWGSASDKTLALAVQTVPLRSHHGMPETGVNDESSSPVAALGVGIALLLGASLVMASRFGGQLTRR